ncbi:hypothetical protein BGZ94_001926 [Podila epigama]|nr:hypothetical protein BGZ94_001926 [Podila epigama]
MSPIVVSFKRCRIVIRISQPPTYTTLTWPAKLSIPKAYYTQDAAANVTTATPSPVLAEYPYQPSSESTHLPDIHRMNPGTFIQRPRYKSQASRYSPQHFYQNRILDPYVQQLVTPITLRQLVFFGRNMQEEKLLKSANYVRTELPVRLAHRIRDFQNLPFIVGTNPHIELVYDLYWQAFHRISRVPDIKTLEENSQFCQLVKSLLKDHLVVIPQLALGIMECSKHIPALQVDQFMNTMLRSRISRRVLAQQHISLTNNFNSSNHVMSDQGCVGIISTHCRPRDIIERTARLASESCRNSLGPGVLQSPKVIMDGDLDAEFSYIPDHIEYILYELLKNSMRFVVQRGKRLEETGELPPIQITVCEGTQDIMFRVSDKGGGISPEVEEHLWSFSQSPERFANFQKVSRMAATVQEQIAPSRKCSEIAYGCSGVSTAHDNTALDQDKSSSASLPSGPNNLSLANMGTAIHNNDREPLYGTTCVAPEKGPPSMQEEMQPQDQSMHLGIGLPMSRVYAEYWGGSLKVFTMHGYGTDAYATFCKFGNIHENFNV